MAKVHRKYHYSWWKQNLIYKKLFEEWLELDTWEVFNPRNEQQETSAESYTWCVADVRRIMRRIEALREIDEIPPIQPARIARVHKDKYGVPYKASKAQAQQHAYLQENAAIDSYGNLLVNGQIVFSHWLQSFDNDKKRAQKEAMEENQQLHEIFMEDE